MTGTQWSSMYRVNSNCTEGSSTGTVAGMISTLLSFLSHSEWITAAMSRSTPRVRWNLSSVDQSL